MYIFIFSCIQCNFIYILNIRVTVSCASCLGIFDPMSVWSSTSSKRFLVSKKFKDNPVWLDKVWPCCVLPLLFNLLIIYDYLSLHRTYFSRRRFITLCLVLYMYICIIYIYIYKHRFHGFSCFIWFSRCFFQIVKLEFFWFKSHHFFY